MSSVLIDTGPLVAFLRESETSHVWAAAKFKELPAPYLTCEPVLAEAFFLVAHHRGGVRRFFDLLRSGLIETDFSVLEEREALWRLIHKYEDLPMSLADACLVRLAELRPGASIFTLDSHFRLYRKNGRQQIPVIMP
ncbi:MAG: PIN domain-containing protein [Chthoniobacteraceae bacterium]